MTLRRNRPVRSSGNKKKAASAEMRPCMSAIRMPAKLGNSENLSAGHLLGHIQNEFAVCFVGLAQQAAKFVKKTRIFAGAAPSDVVTRLAFREVRQLRRFLAVVEELIERHFESASEFLQRFNSRHGVAIFDA